jgi:hypothetical protein
MAGGSLLALGPAPALPGAGGFAYLALVWGGFGFLAHPRAPTDGNARPSFGLDLLVGTACALALTGIWYFDGSLDLESDVGLFGLGSSILMLTLGTTTWMLATRPAGPLRWTAVLPSAMALMALSPSGALIAWCGVLACVMLATPIWIGVRILFESMEGARHDGAARVRRASTWLALGTCPGLFLLGAPHAALRALPPILAGIAYALTLSIEARRRVWLRAVEAGNVPGRSLRDERPEDLRLPRVFAEELRSGRVLVAHEGVSAYRDAGHAMGRV